MKQIYIFLLVFIIGITPVIAKDKIKTNYKDIDISSDLKFNCEPIYNELGECLIKAYVDVNSKKDINYDVTINFKDEGINQYHQKQTKFKGLTNNDKSKSTINLKKDLPQRIEFEFFTSRSGKFDVIFNSPTGNYILDPYYNVTINSSSPSLIINRCPDTIQLSMILIALMFIALGMIAFSIIHQIGVIGLFGSILLLVLSWYVVGCSVLIGYIIGLFALLMLVITSVIIPWIRVTER